MPPDVRHQIIALLPRLRRFARALAGSREDADDLVQAACERALRAIDSWEPGSRLDSWMFRILRNLWIDQLRRKRTERIVDQHDGEIDVAGEDGRRTAESRLELAHVRATIATLPQAQRDVLVLVCIEDLSYREAAAVLDVPVGTVMSRLARARHALAAALAGRERQFPARAKGAL
jgi:RNA polymerase sigma-70 factor, ECF subfamily